jgi:hypothetical protein
VSVTLTKSWPFVKGAHGYPSRPRQITVRDRMPHRNGRAERAASGSAYRQTRVMNASPPHRRLRRGIAVSIVVLASLLVGNETVAALTAGIELGTAPVARAVTHLPAERPALPRGLTAALRTLLILAIAVVVADRALADREPARRSAIVGGATTWRGPPA